MLLGIEEVGECAASRSPIRWPTLVGHHEPKAWPKNSQLWLLRVLCSLWDGRYVVGLNVSSTARSLETVQVALGRGIGEGTGRKSAVVFVRGPSQHSPGVISGNHGKPWKLEWLDRESKPGSPECESRMPNPEGYTVHPHIPMKLVFRRAYTTCENKVHSAMTMLAELRRKPLSLAVHWNRKRPNNRSAMYGCLNGRPAEESIDRLLEPTDEKKIRIRPRRVTGINRFVSRFVLNNFVVLFPERVPKPLRSFSATSTETQRISRSTFKPLETKLEAGVLGTRRLSALPRTDITVSYMLLGNEAYPLEPDLMR
ncbi:hypothetical protein PR048_015393 [Dryococelus australis]|uniref:Uncharacterized protein n=1 Tax=Dryococelus australis TaxID=614101 RepID=A0ABQ9HGX8_9NEOP|nr:hypothetical protein PR048_015393 [Dryococelus australis]